MLSDDRGSLIDLEMSTSKEADLPPTIDTFPTPKHPILSYQSRPSAKAVGELLDQQPAFGKAGKRRSKKGQRLDLRTLLHDSTDESQRSKADDQCGDIEQSVAGLGLQDEEEAEVRPVALDESGEGRRKNIATANLGLKSTEIVNKEMETPRSHDARALAHAAPTVTEYGYDDLAKIDSDSSDDIAGIDYDTYSDDDTLDRSISFPTQARLSKKAKGDRFDPPLDRKDLSTIADKPLAQATNKKKLSKRARATRHKEAEERYEAEEARQQGNLRRGQGRLLGAQAGMTYYGKALGWGKADR
jgi:hypothetical protein